MKRMKISDVLKCREVKFYNEISISVISDNCMPTIYYIGGNFNPTSGMRFVSKSKAGDVYDMWHIRVVHINVPLHIHEYYSRGITEENRINEILSMIPEEILELEAKYMQPYDPFFRDWKRGLDISCMANKWYGVAGENEIA